MTSQNNSHSHVNSRMDGPVMATADDAILSKWSTTQSGYYQDPFLEHFCKGATGLTQQKRRRPPPIIQRGTHARVCVIDRCLQSFLSAPQTTTTTTEEQPHMKGRQVIILGAGKDTSFLRHAHGILWQDGTAGSVLDPSLSKNSIFRDKVTWYEVDHPNVMESKRALLSELPNLTIQEEEADYVVRVPHHDDAGEETFSTCHFVAHDLRQSVPSLLERLIRSHGLQTELPTLVVLECVQMYLPEEESRELWRTIANTFPRAHVALYDPILLEDSFGRVMEQHLRNAGVLPPRMSQNDNIRMSLTATQTLEQQVRKLNECGFDTVVGCDMWNAYETVVTPLQRRRANQCEMLDEVEEWILIMRHYCLVVASTSSTTTHNNSRNLPNLCHIGPDSPLGFTEGKCISMSGPRPSTLP